MLIVLTPLWFWEEPSDFYADTVHASRDERNVFFYTDRSDVFWLTNTRLCRYEHPGE